MDHATHNKIVSFIWSIADDCLRDVFVRGKYRDVILPMFVLQNPVPGGIGVGSISYQFLATLLQKSAIIYRDSQYAYTASILAKQ